MRVIVPTSGGKDSQSSLLWAIEKFGLQSLTACFCDVKWEADETYVHINYLVEKSGVNFKILSSNKYDGMLDLAIKKGRFPSTKARFCTEELKIKPMIDYVLSVEDHVIIIDGVRADESIRRSKMQPNCRYFKHYFEPYLTNSMIVSDYALLESPTLSQRKKYEQASKRLLTGKEDAKFFTYRKKDVFEWCKKYDDSVIRPHFYATADDVIYYSLSRGYDINPRYYRGYSRIGCDPCVMEKVDEIQIMVDNSPSTVERVKYAEKQADSSFFPPGKIPKRYHSKKTKEGKTYATFEDVIRYIKDRKATGDLFKDEPQFRCKSVYNICE
ncbi:phosphoadenosine phosphosulfate reductase family protein [Chryseobacterium sp. WG14]|uniref:phosphoadenosine phosphosulfate reductase domain-containing protein n=1 Tax=Chryseobacterium sp. WG14 TaxID=2926909 RepID=UPI00211E228F|nr:phosphoadenosine phosphosulfate reductase family protein [Chryseobacterium sp. WG14]MCQ9638627.1 phosphoadenosine phosphosulfate reductase family protein [Chryseobacterium sp. WG14]